MSAQSTVRGAILAAGLGTRLRPLTHHLPKPLVPLAGRPLIEFGLDALGRAGVEHVGINAWHLAEHIPERLSHRNERLEFVREATLQGTGGGLRGIAATLPRGTLVALNGDALFDFDLAPLVERHRASGAIATLVLRSVPADSGFGLVGVDATGRLRRIAEVEGPGAEEHTLQIGAYTGVQIVEPALIDALPDGPCDILRTAYRRRMNEGAPVQGVFVDTEALWLDVGTTQRYLEAHRAVLSGRLRAPLPASSTDVRVDAHAQVAATARLEGPCAVLAGAHVGEDARIGPGTFIDREARVAPGADLEDCVVWPGADAFGRLRGEVVLPLGSVR